MSDPVGILVVDKPAGITSHGVVGRVRKALGTRKVGHAGTLDPDATGVLVVGVGQATRLLGYLASSDKAYVSTIVLGETTVTDDAAGEVTATFDAAALTESEVARAMSEFVGEIQQRPSAVSAIKVAGKRAYDLVRSGEDVELSARPVTVHSFDLLGMRHERRDERTVAMIDVSVSCSAGTYVRALARDLGESLGSGGHVSTLRRTRSGAFDLVDAVSLDDVRSAAQLMSAAQAARRTLPAVEIDADAARLARHGVQLPWPTGVAGDPTAFIHGDDLVGVAQQRGDRAVWAAVFG